MATWTKVGPGEWTADTAVGTITAHARRAEDEVKVIVEIWATLPDGTDIPRQKHALRKDAIASGAVDPTQWLRDHRGALEQRVKNALAGRSALADIPEM